MFAPPIDAEQVRILATDTEHIAFAARINAKVVIGQSAAERCHNDGLLAARGYQIDQSLNHWIHDAVPPRNAGPLPDA